jgi:hypothetical protein
MRIFILRSIFKIIVSVLQKRVIVILVREKRFLNWPADPNIRIIPDNPPVVFGRILSGAFINDVGDITCSEEAVSEPRGDVEHAVIFFRQFGTDPALECRRFPPDINSNIKYLSFDTLNQFTLCMRGPLVMKPSQDASHGTGIIILYKVLRDSIPGKLGVLIGFHKKTSFVLKSAGFDEDNLRDVKALKDKWHELLL